MEIIEKQEGKWVILQPKGEIDASSSIDLDTCIKKNLEADQIFLQIDFSGVDYISSAGWGVFTFYYDEIVQKGGEIKMSNMQENIADGFSILGLNELFKVVS